MRQIQEFAVYSYSTTISIPDNAKGVGVVYSPITKHVSALFDTDNASYAPLLSRQFQLYNSWCDIPLNARYCGSVVDPGIPQFGGESYPILWHVYELK